MAPLAVEKTSAASISPSLGVNCTYCKSHRSYKSPRMYGRQNRLSVSRKTEVTERVFLAAVCQNMKKIITHLSEQGWIYGNFFLLWKQIRNKKQKSL